MNELLTTKEGHERYLEYQQCNFGSSCIYWATDIQHYYCVSRFPSHARKWYDPIGWRLTLGGMLLVIALRLLHVAQHWPPRRGPCIID